MIYDLIFLVLFVIGVTYFLYSHKHNLKREGWMFLYRTKLGMEAIDYVGDKYKKTLHVLKYFSIITGFVLMIAMLYLLWKNLYIYISVPEITQIVKAPPIAPLIPYFPKLYGMESFFPPFYFAYFIIALAIVAVSHEFSHGIFMRLFKIKIKSTGFAFLGPFLGAFVEEDKNSFTKKNVIGQMSVLSAGAFANIVFAIILFFIMVIFFYSSFSPSGYAFNTYSYSILPKNETVFTDIGQDNLTIVLYKNQTYYLDNLLRNQISMNLTYIAAYEDAPAINMGLVGVITQINDKKIRNQEDLQEFLIKSHPGDKITIKTLLNKQTKQYNTTLAKHPLNNSMGFLGIGYLKTSSTGIISNFISLLNFKDPSVYYTPRYDGDFVNFVYYLLWWTALINALVGLFNMLPLGILDGGRFFYLAILGITKSEKISKNTFKISSAIIFAIFILLTLIWFMRMF